MTLAVHEWNALDHLLAPQDLAVEETKRGHDLVEEAERDVTHVSEVELLREDLGRTELVGRSVEERRELRDGVEVGLLCPFRVVADVHELVHALTKG